MDRSYFITVGTLGTYTLWENCTLLMLILTKGYALFYITSSKAADVI